MSSISVQIAAHDVTGRQAIVAVMEGDTYVGALRMGCRGRRLVAGRTWADLAVRRLIAASGRPLEVSRAIVDGARRAWSTWAVPAVCG